MNLAPHLSFAIGLDFAATGRMVGVSNSREATSREEEAGFFAGAMAVAERGDALELHFHRATMTRTAMKADKNDEPN